MSSRGSRGRGGGKKFTPNLAAAGKRAEAEGKKDSVKAADAKPRGRGRGRGRGARGSRGGAAGPKKERDLVQDAGIFEAEKRRAEASGAGGSGGGFGRGGGGGAGPSWGGEKREEGAKPRAVLVEEDSEEEAEALAQLLRDDFIADLKQSSLRPVDILKADRMEARPGVVVHKEETPGLGDVGGSAADVFKDGASERPFLIQLPAVLSQLLGPKEPKAPVKAEAGEEEETRQPRPPPSLSALSAGRVGRVEVLRSGRVRLVVGGVELELERGLEPLGASELLRLRLQGQAAEGELDEQTLGPALTAVPDIQAAIRLAFPQNQPAL